MVVSSFKWSCCLQLVLFSLITNDGITKTPAYETALLHPVHISTVEVLHNPTDKSLEITCKIFWDDFEKILTKKNNNNRVDLTSEKQLEENKKLVAAYVGSHLGITIDNKSQSLVFIGFEKEDVVVYSYFEVTNIPTVQTVFITNKLMQDMFNDQTNIVHVIVKGQRKSTKLEYPNSTVKMDF